MKLNAQTISRRHPVVTAVAAAIAALALAACGNEQSTQSSTNLPADTTVTQQPAETARTTGDRVAEGAADLRKEAGEAVGQATDAVTDAAITAAINAELVRDSLLSPMDVDVDTVGGRVALTGKVPSEAAKERAETIATKIDGVVAVDNRLTVAAG